MEEIPRKKMTEGLHDERGKSGRDWSGKGQRKKGQKGAKLKEQGQKGLKEKEIESKRDIFDPVLE